MPQKFRTPLVLSLLLISFFACNKDKNNTPYDSLDAFFKAQSSPETFVADSNQDIIIDAKQGTRLFIPSTAFSGTEGEVTITFEEFFSKSDLMLNNLPTNALGEEWLESGGAFFIDIRNSAGEKVWPEENLELRFPIMDNIANPLNMDVWVWGVEQSSGFGIWNSTRGANTSVTANTNPDVMEYNLFSPAYQWINCDYVFESSAPKVRVRAKLINNKIDSKKIMTFIVFKNINAVLRLTQDNRDFESFEIPVGEEAHLVMIGLENDFYLKIEPFTVTENQNFEIEMEQALEEELLEAIKLLD